MNEKKFLSDEGILKNLTIISLETGKTLVSAVSEHEGMSHINFRNEILVIIVSVRITRIIKILIKYTE